MKTLAAGTSRNIAIKLGDSCVWYEGTWGWIEPNTTTTIEVDLLTLGCGIADVTKVQELYVWFSGGGLVYLDHVRAD